MPQTCSKNHWVGTSFKLERPILSWKEPFVVGNNRVSWRADEIGINCLKSYGFVSKCDRSFQHHQNLSNCYWFFPTTLSNLKLFHLTIEITENRYWAKCYLRHDPNCDPSERYKWQSSDNKYNDFAASIKRCKYGLIPLPLYVTLNFVF